LKTFTLILLAILLTDLSASDSHWETLILEKMLNSMVKKKEIAVYSKNKTICKIVFPAKEIQFTDSCQKADFVLCSSGIDKSCDKPLIVFKYNKYLKNKNAVGVFFWQKGRPTIRFSQKRLEHFKLHVNGELSKFVSRTD